jgi:hypothetical protein
VRALLAVGAGAALALVLAAFARRGKSPRAVRTYAVALVVAALIYVAFAALGVAGARWLLLEGTGVAVFGAAAFLGVRRWPAVLALGWVAHVAWDVGLHLDGVGASFTPWWYPWLCVGFDFVIAAAILGLAREAPRTDPPAT